LYLTLQKEYKYTQKEKLSINELKTNMSIIKLKHNMSTNELN